MRNSRQAAGNEPPGFNSQAEQFNTLERVREVVTREIAYVQYSDVPRDGLQRGVRTDRLPPGQGVVPFPEFFRMLLAKGYGGYLSYEAPNPSAWAWDPEEVAPEALQATRNLLPGT